METYYSLVIDGIEFLYTFESDANDVIYTKFYLGTETVTKRKCGIFGKKYEVVRPKAVFVVPFAITDSSFTKDEVRAYILKQISLMNRQAEIDRGEII